MASNITAIKTMRPAVVSFTYELARKRCLKLYRNCIRSIPYLIQHYNLSYNFSEMKLKFREDFLQFSQVKQKNELDRLAFIGETELYDAMSLLKTRSHVVNYFETHTHKKQLSDSEQLLKKFFE
ncbi:NADH dehydrogenase ubiquinone 1 alpha subcomplex subunit 6 [Tieghemostelium lacteum]|uniref:NADH dehydrogenase ubiquinone 1 alpha subcomplex subunit 6 n=1 Tax=Tieghemostelium lacteum TaxID=361077 RepID=A0A151ZKA7_TIELA|nr:NADH dehydrogenase ubiquinone 1 alpha subcomplex subunit 6 [Tieghemostelium lacteum]|eukprot:KYQ94320.1 NADH dehydrogenase ubiquinone 1 alpha subcomplex subunit 6 [Tieghemostelium lacteum]